MPNYEYVCRSCDIHLEVVQRFDEASLTECPTCGGALRKVFGSIGIAFKGSGFYKTDSRPSSGSSSKTDAAGDSKDTKEPKKEAASTTSDSSSTKTDSPTKTDAPKKKEPAASGSGSGSGSTAKSA